MGGMDQRAGASPPLPPQAPAEESMSFDEYYRRHGGRRLAITSSARRAPEAPRPRPGLTKLLLTPIPLPRLPRLGLGLIRRLFARLRRLLPGRVRRSKAARVVRSHPGLSAWLVVFLGAWAVVGAGQLVEPHIRWEPERYGKWLARRGARAVKATLAEIGPGVHVPKVRAMSISESILGLYHYRDSSVTFNAGREYDDLLLFDVTAHECVHAIYHQHDLIPLGTPRDDFFTLVDETTAYVLGAHIAGELWAQRGYDGSLLTEAMFQNYRSACDPANPVSIYARFLDPDRAEPNAVDRGEWHSLLVHFGPPLELVDAIHDISYLNSDPVTACRKIADRFMRKDLDPRDQPILEAFERTKREGYRP